MTPAEPMPEPTAEQLASATRGRRRREPRYRAFVGTGVLAGVLAAVVLTLLVPDPGGRYSASSVFGYLAASLGAVGALLGGGAAVLAARR